MDYPIRVVATQTGISPATLRMWEKRYPGIAPRRDAHGRRLYPPELVLRLKRLASLVGEGYRISDIAGLDTAELGRLQQELSRGAGNVEMGTGSSELEEALEAVRRMDSAALHRSIDTAIRNYGELDVVDSFIFPLVKRLEAMVASRRARPVQLSMLNATLAEHLYSRLPPLQEATGTPVVALTVLRGQRGMVGAIASMIHVVAAGWYPIMLGSDLPADDIAAAVRSTGARALVVSVVMEDESELTGKDVSAVARLSEGTVPVLFGGRMPETVKSQLIESGLHFVENMDNLRETLGTLAA